MARFGGAKAANTLAESGTTARNTITTSRVAAKAQLCTGDIVARERIAIGADIAKKRMAGQDVALKERAEKVLADRRAALEIARQRSSAIWRRVSIPSIAASRRMPHGRDETYAPPLKSVRGAAP